MTPGNSAARDAHQGNSLTETSPTTVDPISLR
jgi:hypothetical protein